MGCLQFTRIFPRNYFDKNENISEYELPDEIWAIIFTYLDQVTIHTRVSLVNKRWFYIIRTNQKLSNRLELSSRYLLTNFKLNRPLNFCMDAKLHENLSCMLERWPKLKILKFQLKEFQDFNFFISHFNKLDDFKKLWNMPFLNEVILIAYFEINTHNFIGIDGIIYNSDSWTVSKLEIADTNYITNFKNDFIQGLEMIATRINKIEQLNLNLGIGDVMLMRGSDLNVFLKLPIQSLTTIKITVTNTNGNNFIKAILKNCPKVKTILIDCFGYRLPQELVFWIQDLKNLKKLLILNLTYDINYTNFFTKYNDNIKELILEKVSISGEDLLHFAKMFRQLDVFYVHKVKMKMIQMTEFFKIFCAADIIKNIQIFRVHLEESYIREHPLHYGKKYKYFLIPKICPIFAKKFIK